MGTSEADAGQGKVAAPAVDAAGARATWARWLVALPLGAVVGTAGDQIHVRFGVLSYPRPAFLGEAWWVPLLFALVGVAMVVGARVFADRAPTTRARLVAYTAASFAIFFAAYFSTGLFGGDKLALTGGLVGAWLVHAAIVRDARMVALSLVLAACGPLVEAALSSTGAFAYARPDWVVPLWLPALYLHVAPFARGLERLLFAPPRA